MGSVRKVHVHCYNVEHMLENLNEREDIPEKKQEYMHVCTHVLYATIIK